MQGPAKLIELFCNYMQGRRPGDGVLLICAHDVGKRWGVVTVATVEVWFTNLLHEVVTVIWGCEWDVGFNPCNYKVVRGCLVLGS